MVSVRKVWVVTRFSATSVRIHKTTNFVQKKITKLQKTKIQYNNQNKYKKNTKKFSGVKGKLKPDPEIQNDQRDDQKEIWGRMVNWS